MENKAAIIKAFVNALKLTRMGEYIVDAEYYKDGSDETCILYIKDPAAKKPKAYPVNISADSGVTIMKDIIFALEY